VKDLEQKGLLKYVVGGFQSVLKRSADLQPFRQEPSDYSLLFIGTPVWAGNLTPAVRTFLSRPDLKGRKVALFCCYDGNPRDTLSNMEAALSRSTVVGKTAFVSPLEGDQNKTRRQAAEWARSIANDLEGATNAG
jgi:hypothetical protein